MINSTPSPDRTARPDLTALVPPKNPVVRPGTDRFSATNSAALHAALAAQPEIRPEVVARGRALAADPAYPPVAVLRQIGQMFLRAPDLTEETD
jgi:hypothetical protein